MTMAKALMANENKSSDRAAKTCTPPQLRFFFNVVVFFVLFVLAQNRFIHLRYTSPGPEIVHLTIIIKMFVMRLMR